jgi:hemerythrin-like metal-binding protein
MNCILFIRWQDCNDTGIALIDEQHRGIVSIINSFHYLTQKDPGNDILYSFISDTMKNYSRIHFITEERILKAAEYPDYERHKELHKNLALSIARIEHAATTEKDSRPLLDFLKRWWIEHINEQDMQYVPHLHSRGMTDS